MIFDLTIFTRQLRKHWFRVFIIGYLLLGNRVAAQEHPGIHQLQLQYYNKHYPALKTSSVTEPIIPKQTRARAPSRTVFGYHPYWMGTAWQNYNYNLLTTIAYFSAEATPTGGFSDLHGWPPTGLINMAHSNGVAVVLCVTMFSRDNLTTLLSNSTYRQNLINNIVTQVRAGNADGVNIDFEVFPASQKQNMVRFITDLTDTLHAAIPGSQVTLAMPAVDWNDAWDYKALATVSDGLFIMGYDYHWRNSPTTGAVAPLTGGTYNVTRTVNDYLTKTGGQADKLILGCPYYGFEWPATGGQAGASTTGSGKALLYSTAEPLALSYGKLWDSNSQTPWYRYQNPGWFQGWYDDSLSLALKYGFAIQKDLQGVGMWALGYDGNNTELWDALANSFGAAAAPTMPGNLSIRNVGDGTVMIHFTGAQTADRFIVFRGYPDNQTIDTLGIFTQTPIIIDGLTAGEEYYLRLRAANESGESPLTEMLGVVPTRGTPRVLIVNGFDRESGTTNTFDFIRRHGPAIHNRGYSFDAASNEAIMSGTVSLRDYRIVDWILGEEGTATNSFTPSEQSAVAEFLENGGNLLVSGSEIGYDLVAKGSEADRDFYREYLKAQYISDAAGGQRGTYTVYGVAESIFDGLGPVSFDDGTHGTYDVDWPDGIKPVAGADICAKYQNVNYDNNGGAGVSYYGSFGNGATNGAVVYLAVGFETIYPANNRNIVMADILSFFEQVNSVSDDAKPIAPTKFSITTIYPNPSNGMVTILIKLPDRPASIPRLTISNIYGQTIVSTPIPAHTTTWTWDGKMLNGRLAPSGVYLAALTVDRRLSVKKFTLVK
ncbi:MAG: T9SS type A sorting domain-containing protein [FCB group bacterium]|nr:T9SS type A sorting domain-containing protein [FCB group bacterium]